MRVIDRARAGLALLAGRLRKQPQRETNIYPRLVSLGQTQFGENRPSFKPTPRNLRFFGRQPYARRAINAIKNPIAQLAWEVVPIPGVQSNKLLDQQCEIVRRCLESPNSDDSFRSLIEQVIEDILHGAGAIEQQVGGDQDRPLWLWPVDGLSVQIYAAWSGDANEPRYAQGLGYGPTGGVGGIPLCNNELIYIRPNPTTWSPFGLGPLETAFLTISRQLGVAQYAGDVASNAQPTAALYAGEQISPEEMQAMRTWWTNEIEGRGVTPIFGGPKSPQVLQLRHGGDDALYLKYQQMLAREIAVSFDLSPQNMGIEQDVNRNTAEVGEDRDWDHAIKPMASLIESHLNREAIQGRLGFSQVRFRFVGLDREDEKATANIYQLYYQGNAITPNEQRERLGMPRMENMWGDLCYADMQVALQAARGTAIIEDQDLDKAGGKPLDKSNATDKPASKRR